MRTSPTSSPLSSSTRARRRRRRPKSSLFSSRIPIPPAVSNALFDAVGVRVDEIPATPEKVHAALKLGAAGQVARVGPVRFPEIPYPPPMRVLTPEEGGDGRAV